MPPDVQKRLRFCISLTLGLLPRWAKHDFWRVCEPQHQRAHDAITEAILSRIDSEFEVAMEERPPSPVYTGTGGHAEAKRIRDAGG